MADRIAAGTRWADEGVLQLDEALALVAELGATGARCGAMTR